MLREVEMLSAWSGLRFYLYRNPTDMRKGFDGLCGIVINELGRDALSGDVYVFVNRNRNRMKLLVWERTGFWLFYKRLEKGTFQRHSNSTEVPVLELTYTEVILLTEGIDLTSAKKRLRY